jgi:hypothetical protein
VALVRPTTTFNSVIEDCPNGVILTTGDILSDSNPHVRARPDMFEPVRATVGAPDGVEEATARPGVKRSR